MQVCRINQGGNYCLHNKINPDLSLIKNIRSGPGGQPAIITKAIERVEAYFKNPACLPSLNNSNLSLRTHRSEARESCIITIKALLKYTDIMSLRIGFQKHNGFESVSHYQIHAETRLSFRRYVRAIRYLKRAGIITVTQPRLKDKDGNYRGLCAVKCINKAFFGCFGLAAALKHERDKRSKKQLKKDQGTTKTEQSRRQLSFSSIANNLKKNKSNKRKQSSLNTELEKKRQYLAYQIKLKEPHLTAAECNHKANELLDSLA